MILKICVYYFSGIFCDAIGSYDSAFYLAGITIGISGFMLYFIPGVERYIEKKRVKYNGVAVNC